MRVLDVGLTDQVEATRDKALDGPRLADPLAVDLEGGLHEQALGIITACEGVIAIVHVHRRRGTQIHMYAWILHTELTIYSSSYNAQTHPFTSHENETRRTRMIF